ncbi:hypothetical protein THAR02_00229 [Trichoderma harzianum]|uniref:Uncharacterized protein n=1 Tax=Trichoderma harzianum TaxID=5544 RepID=A0A0F9Y6L3_TRIHA|nr:hypothetical protein THAR02_00229 [Trichoderma harzianum]
MAFVPESKPKGYSYFEDGARDWQQKTEEGKDMRSIESILSDVAREAILDEVLKLKPARVATTVVQKGIRHFYDTPGGKIFIEKFASVSLGKSVYGAAALSHVSKVVRSHGISNFGIMLINDGKLFHNYINGDIDGSQLGRGLWKELTGSCGDLLGWSIGAGLAAALVLNPWGATMCTFVGSNVGRLSGQYLAALLTST